MRDFFDELKETCGCLFILIFILLALPAVSLLFLKYVDWLMRVIP